MKVQRYTKGATNVAELQSQAAAVISPEEAAGAAAAPYEAAGKIAGLAADEITNFGVRKIEAENKEDAMASALNVSNYKNTTEANKKQAIAENWTPEQFEANQGAVDKEFMDSLELLSERNRPKMMQTYQSAMAGVQLETAITSGEIKRNLQGQDYQAQRAQSVQNKTYETTMFLDDMARQSGLIEEAEYIKLSALTEGQITAEGWMGRYKDAVKAGTEDDLMLEMSKADLTDEARTFFNQDKAQYDAATKKIADQFRQEKGLKISNYFHYGITRSTRPEDITAFIRNNNIINEGTMSKLYGRLQSIQNDESVVMSNDYNPASASDRKAFDALLPNGPNVPEREKFEGALGIAVVRNIAPKWLDGYFNRGAYKTENPQEYVQVAEDYHNYVLMTDRVPVTITDEARSGFEMYHDLRQANTDSATAGGLVLNKQKATTEDAFEANLASFDMPEYGAVDDVAPGVTIKKLLDAKIESEFATRMGLNITERGLIWDTDKIPPIPAALRREMNRVSRNMWGYTTNEEVAANAAFGSLRASGWSATDANEGVTAPDGTKMGYQYMRNPPEKPFAITRAEMGQDIEGIKFQVPGEYKEGTARFNWRTVEPEEIELGEGQVYTNESKEQKMRWPMLVNGEQLLSRKDGETKLEFFEYGEQPRVNEEDFSILEEAHKRATEEGRKRAIHIDPGLEL